MERRISTNHLYYRNLKDSTTVIIKKNSNTDSPRGIMIQLRFFDFLIV